MTFAAHAHQASPSRVRLDERLARCLLVLLGTLQLGMAYYVHPLAAGDQFARRLWPAAFVVAGLCCIALAVRLRRLVLCVAAAVLTVGSLAARAVDVFLLGWAGEIPRDDRAKFTVLAFTAGALLAAWAFYCLAAIVGRRRGEHYLARQG